MASGGWRLAERLDDPAGPYAVRAAAGLGLAGLGIPDLTAVAGFLG
jgi:hypothetical protein